MKELLDTYWKDKTVVLVGDSIGNLIYYGAVRCATRERQPCRLRQASAQPPLVLHRRQVCEAAKAYDVTVDVHAGAAAGNELHSRCVRSRGVACGTPVGAELRQYSHFGCSLCFLREALPRSITR